MPLTVEDFVHENSGVSASGTSVVVALAGADSTADGNTVIIVLSTQQTVSAVPSGFATDKTIALTTSVYRKSGVAAGETSWTFTLGTSGVANWYVVELSNIDPVEPLDTSIATGTPVTANGGTLSTGTTPLNAGLSVVALAIFVSKATTPTWSGYTNNFEEVIDPIGTASYVTAVARRFQDGSTTTFETTATLASSSSDNAAAIIVAYRAADTSIVAPLSTFVGFEWGTHGGIANTGTGTLLGYTAAPVGTWGTNYLIQAGSARNSNYGLRLTGTAASFYAPVGNFGAGIKGVSCGMNVRVVSATGTVVVASVNLSITVKMQLLYDSATTKFGVRAGTTGTVQWESGTTALNTWRWIGWRLKINAATWNVDWRIETGTNTYTAQTSATLGGQSATTNVDTLVLGNSGATQTMTADYDDVVASPFYAAYPLGPHTVKLLTVDTGGTPTVSGTSSNFSVFTANGTLAAWNAINARDAVDEVPPTVSASADGVVQTAVAASDYIEFPMATYTCAANEIIAGVRMLAPLWGGTGTGTGQLGIRGHDGTVETTLDAGSTSYDAGSPTAYSSTEPRWSCANWTSVNGWTQDELDAAVTRVGFSADATPDMGIDAIYLETAIKSVDPVRTLSLEEGDVFTVDVYVHPYTSATVSYVITNNDATRDVTFDYSISGTPQTPVVVGPSTNSTLQLNADVYGDISDITLTPEAA